MADRLEQPSRLGVRGQGLERDGRGLLLYDRRDSRCHRDTLEGRLGQTQLLDQVAHGGVALARVLGQGSAQDRDQRGRQRRILERRRLVDLPVQHGHGAFARERHAPGEQLEGHDAEGVDVAALVDALALGLLRAHVLGRADDHPGRGELRAVLLRDPEVEQRTRPRESIRMFWVLRSRWMMPTSWIAWSPAAISSATSNASSASRPPGRAEPLQVGPADQLHRDVAERALLAVLVDATYVPVGDLARELDLRLEAAGHFRILGDLCPEHLDRHPLVEQRSWAL